jgi:chromosome segregation ATPase
MDAMQTFIRGQMGFILAPIGESVRDIEDDIGLLKEAAARERKRGDALEANVRDDGPRLDELLEKVKANDDRIDRLSEEVPIIRQEKSRLETDHEVTKATLQRVEASIRTMDEKSQVMALDLESLKAAVLRLEFALQSANGAQAASGEHIAEMKDFCEGLNQRHIDLVQDLKDLGRSGAVTDRALQKFQQEYADQKVALVEGARQLEAQAVDMEKQFVAKVQTVRNDFDVIQTDITRLKALRLAQDAADRRIKQLEDLQAQAESERSSMTDELSVFHQEHVELNKEVTALKKHVLESTRALEDAARLADRSRADLSKNIDAHAGAIEQVGSSTRDLQTGQSQIQTLLADVRRDTYRLQEWRNKDVIPKFDTHANDIQGAYADIGKLSKDVGISKEELLKLKEELAAANVVIAKLGSRYDVCSGQIQGISKGFQDTSRSVASGAEGMIKPKSKGGDPGAPERTLPPLPSAECEGFGATGTTRATTPAATPTPRGGRHTPGLLSARGVA